MINIKESTILLTKEQMESKEYSVIRDHLWDRYEKYRSGTHKMYFRIPDQKNSEFQMVYYGDNTLKINIWHDHPSPRNNVFRDLANKYPNLLDVSSFSVEPAIKLTLMETSLLIAEFLKLAGFDPGKPIRGAVASSQSRHSAVPKLKRR